MITPVPMFKFQKGDADMCAKNPVKTGSNMIYKYGMF